MSRGIGEVEIWLLIACSVWALVTTSFLCHSLFLMWDFHKCYWMQSRWTKRQIEFISVSFVIFTIMRPLTLLHFFVVEERPVSDLPLGLAIFDGVMVVIHMAAVSSMIAVFSARVWHQWFEANLAVRVGIAEWKSMIDESLISDEMSWFIRNKDTLGNRQYIERFGFSLSALLTVFSAVANIYWRPSYIVLFALVSLCFVLLLIFCAQYYPAFKDEIHLRLERKVASMVIASSTALWLICTLLPFIFGWDWKRKRRARVITEFITQLVAGLIFPVAAFVISNVVIGIFIKPVMSFSLCGKIIPLHFSARSRKNSWYSIQSFGGRSVTDSSMSSGVTLQSVFAHNDAFRAFMDHLFAEFSYENALCYIECIKFRDQLTEMTDVENISKPESANFCSDIRDTRSTIVDRMQTLDQAREVASHLCSKYVTMNATYHVNLGHHTRQKALKECVQSNSSSNVYLSPAVFDTVIQDSKRLLKESFSRFVETSAFVRVSVT